MLVVEKNGLHSLLTETSKAIQPTETKKTKERKYLAIATSRNLRSQQVELAKPQNQQTPKPAQDKPAKPQDKTARPLNLKTVKTHSKTMKPQDRNP